MHALVGAVTADDIDSSVVWQYIVTKHNFSQYLML